MRKNGQPNSLIGNRYRLVKPIGIGGMSDVWEAIDTHQIIQRNVVVKLLRDMYRTNADYRAMFAHEVRGMRAVRGHPNFPEILDQGHDDGYYIAMERLYGVTLERLMHSETCAGRSMPLSMAVAILCEIASALDYMHELADERGVPLELVHRDVSPANIIVTSRGVPKLVDFGLVYGRRSDLGNAGALLGKPAYMSPEQSYGASVDRRSDIFSLGVVAYEMTTGIRLFQSDNVNVTLARLRAGEVPKPSSRVYGYPAELERIVLTALARRPEERYQSALELRADLQRFAINHGLCASCGALAQYVQEASTYGTAATIDTSKCNEIPTVCLHKRRKARRPGRFPGSRKPQSWRWALAMAITSLAHAITDVALTFNAN